MDILMSTKLLNIRLYKLVSVLVVTTIDIIGIVKYACYGAKLRSNNCLIY